MKSIATELEKITDSYVLQLKSLSEPSLSYKPSPAKWSKKELIGHMIDSAQNNIRRFIVTQYEDKPQIIYNQDSWVSINQWQNYQLSDLVDLWYQLNKQITVILKNSPAEVGQREVQTEALHKLEWIATDYIKHLKHHLHQILEMEPVAYP